MKGLRRIALNYFAVLLTAAGVLAVVDVGQAPAAGAASAISCDSVQSGTRIPILLVHGFHSDATTWSTQTINTLGTDAAHTCVATFDYGAHSTAWVTDPHIGKALANRVIALAGISAVGKVIIVAHSMGGLAVRCAADSGCNGEVAGVSSKIAGVITFGTPNLGTFLKGYLRSDLVDALAVLLASPGACHGGLVLLENLCPSVEALGTSAAAKAFTPGSSQLTLLPALQATIPVEAIAGSVKITDQLFDRSFAVGDGGDLVVSEDSALAAQREVNGVGGTATVDCGSVDVFFLVHPQSSESLLCVHTSETSDATFATLALATITKLVHASGVLGYWTDPTIVATTHSLGAATLTMSVAQIESATRTTLREVGDGESDPMDVEGVTARPGVCFGGFQVANGPRLVTSDGFVLGEGVAALTRIYGNRLRYTPGHPGGEYATDGWYVTDAAGTIFFQGTQQRIDSISIQAPTATPIHC